MLVFTTAVRLFALAVGVAQAQEEVSTEITPCDDWEKDAAAYQDAFAKWQEPLCYKFTYSSIASGFDSTPVVRTVLNGTTPDAELTSGYYYFQTLTDVWKWIEEQCFLYCPTSGVLACEIQYATSDESGLAYPSSFKIDPDDKVDGDEVSLRIEDVVAFDCLSSSAFNESVKLCEVWEVRAATFQEAFTNFKKWQEPPCYTFMYSDMGIYSGGKPVLQTVQNGTSLGDEGYSMFLTLGDAWNMIDEWCFQSCTVSWGYLCDVQYATNNETNVIYPAFFNITEEFIYKIKNIQAMDCANVTQAPDDDSLEFGSNPCFDWEEGAAAYEEAFAKWQEPECYTFTYLDQGIWSSGEPVVRTVLNGSSFQDGDGEAFQTLTEVWNAIEEHCFRNCPTSGAHYCQVEYATNTESGLVYPSSFNIDFEYMMADDESMYAIEDVRTIDCAELEGIDRDVLKPDVCDDYLEVKNSLEVALRNWENAGDCYNYTIERLNYYVEQPLSEEYLGPFQIVVMDGIPNIVGDTTLSEMNQTLSDWLAEIQDKVVDRCLAEHDQVPYDLSSIQYDPIWGYPALIYFDPDGSVVDDEFYYNISEFSRCSGLKPGVCVDYDRVKSSYYTAMMSWNYLTPPECYAYSIERQGMISDEDRGPFQILVQDGIAQVVTGPTTKSEENGPNGTLTLSDRIAEIIEHCILGCESDSSLEAYYNCSLEFSPDGEFPKYFYFDVDGDTTGDEYGYSVLHFLDCNSFNTFDQQKSDYDAARANLEAVLTETPCYDFTYTTISADNETPESVTVNVHSKVTALSPGNDTFSSLLDLMSLYRSSCFPFMTQDYFRCEIFYDELGIPSLLMVGYDDMLGVYTTTYQVDNVTFVSCDTQPSSGGTIVSATRAMVYAGAIFGFAFLIYL